MTATAAPTITSIPLARIQPWPGNPRKRFDEQELADLAQSIREKGLLQPLVVRPVRPPRPILDDYTLLVEIAGSDGNPRSAECVTKLEKAGLSTYGHLKHQAKVYGGDLVEAAVGVGCKKVEAKALVAAIEKLPTHDQVREQTYEIAAGERRYRAAGLAGLTEVPCIVRQDLDDKAMLEIAVIENEQRQDVTAMEKARGYQALLQQHGYTADHLATKIGKSKAYIYGLVKLVDLPKKAAEALEAGDIPASTAGLIARVPTPALRERVAEAVVLGLTCYNAETFQAPEFSFRRSQREEDDDPLSYRDTKELIQNCCMVELKQAPFDRQDPDLAGGSCEACPKRVGNLAAQDPETYAGVRADVCTDPGCYRAKVEAWQLRKLADAEVNGQKVLSEKEAKKLFPYGSYVISTAPYLDLADHDREDKKKRTYGQVLAKRLVATQVALCFSPDGRLHELVAKDVALPILRELRPGKSGGNGSDNGHAYGREDKAERAKRAKRLAESRLRRAVDREILARAASTGERLFAGLEDVEDWPMAGVILRSLAHWCLSHAWNTDDMVARRGHKAGRKQEEVQVLTDVIQAGNPSQLMGLIIEFLAAKTVLTGYSVGYGDRDGKALATALGINRKAIEKEVKERLKAEKAAKNGHAGNGKAEVLAEECDE